LSKGNPRSGNSEVQYNKQIQWRRNKVQELLVKGFNEYNIATELKVSQSTVSRDISYVQLQARENLQKHIQERLPQEYQCCMAGINRILQLTWEIAEKPTDDKTRLQAFAQLNEGYKFKMDLTTNGVVITDAIKFVQTNKEKLTMSSKKEDNGSKESKEPDYYDDKDQLEEEQEEETGEIKQETTNEVF
jgi:predicted transcriptional regulator